MSGASLLAAVAALAAVLALIKLAGSAAARGWLPLGAAGISPDQKILGIAAVLRLDGRRRVVLIRCGGRHVAVMTGGPQDLVLGWSPDPPA